MSKNPVALKIAAPYARALFDFVKETGTLLEVTSDIQNIQGLLFKSKELFKCLQNPLVSNEAKQEILIKVVGKKMNSETLQFLTTLIKRNRINLLSTIIFSYLELVYKTANSQAFQIVSANDLSNGQRTRLIKKIKSVIENNRIMIQFSTDKSLIGGFLIKNQGKIVDYSVKNKLKTLAKLLDTVLEI
uniref:ATP synthase CF1 subunit delta n=1 Tax=Thalassionema bacillare TaxID=426664 RepID=UPI001EDD3563|nr:ATP synthase CF1 subunit delta [Thalassionema bacillare]UHY40498.1 ATP synthase CF1 subunit delta [Thalassionema bacillare]UHY40885.1 ATP synthase CF1 subunit delta [Thalassionema bacillare]UHY41143.1 ATP synthase CF1 subunit delta [Thalassionema bacillare]